MLKELKFKIEETDKIDTRTLRKHLTKVGLDNRKEINLLDPLLVFMTKLDTGFSARELNEVKSRFEAKAVKIGYDQDSITKVIDVLNSIKELIPSASVPNYHN